MLMTAMAGGEPRRISSEMERAAMRMAEVQSRIEGFIFGQSHVIKLAAASIIANGHILFQGGHGLGKTRLTIAFSQALNLDTKRIQGVPDLLPADIIGAEVLKEDGDPGKIAHFQFVPGPLFASLAHVDEINRISTRAQAALLQAMQERRVTVNGVTHQLPRPNLVLATQNPASYEAVYPLLEPQLDRFHICINMRNIDRESARRVLRARDNELDIQPVLYSGAEDVSSPDGRLHEILEIQKLARTIAVHSSVEDFIFDLVDVIRNEDGTSPACIADNFEPGLSGERPARVLTEMGCAFALLSGEPALKIQHVKEIAVPALVHRMVRKHTKLIDDSQAERHIAELVLNMK